MNPGAIGVFIPIIAIVMGIGIAMLGTWTEHKRRSQLMEQSHRERMAALEKGQPMPEIPTGLISAKSEDTNPRHAPLRAMRSGLTLLGIGVVLYFGLQRLTGEDIALFGLIPAVVGAANLIYAGLLARKEREAGPGAG
jgi:cadmium resistance protein CadD (predicted permease)